ncbi:PAN-3 domain-containing protein [Caenorhabditis elegans]|uniref:PAN-3 domain-containing protein n=1 Tax=Caenorhabditis elegans TaxID=6239 RepID=O16208_CAEEL|nr:PAN-3 domain-containing protein [Caenorhabditis elegans]CCD69017.1 PAN-3 domain-containing protein [Caenorhabditis elegans]|eukprot:NP_494350.2 Uncharacterized protein CELE_F29A7.3 [Caenorhabditis elegans]
MRNILIFALCALASSAAEAPGSSHSPSFKFGTVHGEPDDYANSTSVQVKNFKECIEKCSAIFDCIVASQKSPSEPCNLFLWNSVEKVKRNDSGGEGLTAFRVFTEQPSCKLNVALLLNGKKYQIYSNDTQHYLWTINAAADGWTIKYSRS